MDATRVGYAPRGESTRLRQSSPAPVAISAGETGWSSTAGLLVAWEVTGALRHQRTDDPRGITRYQHIRRYVLDDHAAGADHRTRANGHARADNRPATDPDIVTDRDRAGILQAAPALGSVHGVQRGVDLHRGAEQDVIADGYRGNIENDAIDVEKDLATQADVPTVITKERRQDDRIGRCLEQLRQQFGAFGIGLRRQGQQGLG